ncbi:MAG TPA: APC family permease [Gemmatimonadaceae bacterium]|nr:APC family permease [Gemmatimonadaceae bacterium]
MASFGTYLKRLLFGRPLASERLEHERLGKITALAVLSSDAISSVAYATDQILIVLAVLGAMALQYVIPISAVIVGLLVLVGLSYRQTVFAYPGGGGSYTVAKENLGTMPGLVAAAALLTDYILTVSVSIASGVDNMISAFPTIGPWRVLLCVVATLILMVVNLRGVRESGAVFRVPTYAFIFMMIALIFAGVIRSFGQPAVVPQVPQVTPLTGFALSFLLLRAFSEGCSAMTGTEAISNGVMVFKAPAPKNAATTLVWMVTLLAMFFLGTSILAHHYGLVVTPLGETVLSQLGHRVFSNGFLYYALIYSTFAVLVLAANTAFADFPRLGSILANDRYMPRQLAARGDRLAFSNGIVTLAFLAIFLIWIFHGNTNALIPLYAVGVFVCFTLSQAGMVVHWFKCREPGWQWRAALNGLGATATGIVSIIQVWTKFTTGAWIVVLIIPALVGMLIAIHRHYVRFAEAIKFDGRSVIQPLRHVVVVPINGISKATAGALVYATTISTDVRAVYVEVDPKSTEAVRKEWEQWDIGVDLVVVPSPYRSIIRPLVKYVDELRCDTVGELVSVVVPEIVPKHWWEHLLHNKTALYIRTAFLFRPNVVVVAVPFHLGKAARIRDLIHHDEMLDEPEAAAS